MEGNITLILKGIYVKVNKEKLASKSRYFESLFSHNFNDSHSREHVINYDISLRTLENFVEWIHDDQELVSPQYQSIKVSMTKFMSNNFTELLNLLQLSILFATDDLTNDITDIIILHWLKPKKIIGIWLLAQELSIKTLQDVCLSVCLDRFQELPVSSLVKLTKDNINCLLQNINVRSSTKYLKYIRKRWIKHHTTSDIIEIEDKNRQLKFIQGTIIHNACKSVVKNVFLYTWNGCNLSKCTELKNMEESGNMLIGMQVASRGFSIYIIGGEWGLGTGKFNNIIWRYCLLSKKWYYQSHLPAPRRHMVAVFLKNKLVVAGGVGRHRLKLPTVDILHIHTGNWTRCATTVPENFTEVPPHCVMNGKLFLLKSSLYIYSEKADYWHTVQINNPAIQSVAFFTPRSTLFLIGNHLGETVLSRIDVKKDSGCEKGDCLEWYSRHNIINVMDVVRDNELYQVRYACIADTDIIVLNTYSDPNYEYLHLYTETRKDLENSSIPKLGCINIIDPATLYHTVQL